MAKGQVQTERAMARVGERHGSLVLVEFVGSNKYRRALFRCKCDCGNEVVKESSALKDKSSCGCVGKKIQLAAVTKHGGCRRITQRSELHFVWSRMKARCSNKNSRDFKWYGGKGVVVCERWINDFAAFRDDMEGTYFVGASIDRIDSNGNYEPSNCRWLPHSENCRRAAMERWEKVASDKRNGKYRGG